MNREFHKIRAMRGLIHTFYKLSMSPIEDCYHINEMYENHSMRYRQEIVDRYAVK